MRPKSSGYSQRTISRLAGANGAGKSTTIKMLTGMLIATSGTAEVGGFDVVKDPLSVKRIIGYVPKPVRVFEKLRHGSTSSLSGPLSHPGEPAARIERFGEFLISPPTRCMTNNCPLTPKECVKK